MSRSFTENPVDVEFKALNDEIDQAIARLNQHTDSITQLKSQEEKGFYSNQKLQNKMQGEEKTEVQLIDSLGKAKTNLNNIREQNKKSYEDYKKAVVEHEQKYSDRKFTLNIDKSFLIDTINSWRESNTPSKFNIFARAIDSLSKRSSIQPSRFKPSFEK